MGKITSLYGKTTGKIGSIVFATSGGETIAREYNPHVSNPSTSAQVNQRARLKLMSQLSAALADSIVMTKEGLVSRRNKFTKRNMDSCYASDGVAQISYENVQLTEGSVGLPQLIGGIADWEGFEIDSWAVALATQPAENVKRVCYNIFVKTDEGSLSLLKSVISETRGTDGKFFMYQDAAFLNYGKELVVLAYGMIDTSESATARYGNLNVQNGSDIARLVANRTINYMDYQFTQTRGLTIGANGQAVQPTPAGSARVFVTALGTGGTVSGGGTFQIGSTVQVTATPASGYTFSRWIYNGTNTTASTSAQYSFTLEGQTDLVAVFDNNQGGGGL